ncbi:MULTISPECIES: hypothetical protein [Vibrio]|jgi:hypothetical protein|uniref:hypothetical protein n=1 Tax=Vibrio TaxID=662 RepID=UPI001FAE00E4|nr:MULTISPECIES: hypothetical protein [Vibrio]MCS0030021.1 hypothetical protein [Vibrio alginolyticus]MEA3483424.1 hypothetical protein [Pseudomonadota bacterium]MCG9621453.1 hypothetical protein [Vibrio diabolicus]MCJ0883417.1 hypothetical protein [Vibrio sp. CCB-PB317]MCR9365089.1 hypothetical protein [Vibrio antiquarius]
MNKCPAIIGVVFDEKSLKAIDRINELHELERSAKVFISLGNLWSIFGGNSLKGTASSGLSKAITAIPATARLETAKNVSVGLGRGISSDASQTAWSISQANWEYYFKSYSALDQIKLREIEKIATFQALDHVHDSKQYRFWKAISDGCKI